MGSRRFCISKKLACSRCDIDFHIHYDPLLNALRPDYLGVPSPSLAFPPPLTPIFASSRKSLIVFYLTVPDSFHWKFLCLSLWIVSHVLPTLLATQCFPGRFFCKKNFHHLVQAVFYQLSFLTQCSVRLVSRIRGHVHQFELGNTWVSRPRGSDRWVLPLTLETGQWDFVFNLTCSSESCETTS